VEVSARALPVSALIDAACGDGVCSTPLNGVVAMTELLAGTPLTPEQAEQVACIQDSARLLLVVVNDLLDFNRATCGKLQLQKLPMDLAAVVKSSTAVVARAAEAKRQHLTADLAAVEGWSVVGDPDRLKQVRTCKQLAASGMRHAITARPCVTTLCFFAVATAPLQILVNLLSNSVRFTGCEGSITLSTVVVDGPSACSSVTVRFSVTDTGIGIDADTLRRLWSPFVQGDASTTRRYGGSGLGLSIVKELVALMGGEVGVASTVGEGSTFWFQVPLPLQAPPATVVSVAQLSGSFGTVGSRSDAVVMRDSHQSASAGVSASSVPLSCGSAPVQPCTGRAGQDATSTPCPAGAASVIAPAPSAAPLATPSAPPSSLDAAAPVSRRQPLILVAEDNATNVLVITRMLSRIGYNNVIVAVNGKEAVEAVAAHDVDLVLMDCHMDVMDGFQACRTIRGMGGSKSSVPVLAVTASALDSDRRACQEAGMNDVIVKPLAMASLLSALKRHLPA